MASRIPQGWPRPSQHPRFLPGRHCGSDEVSDPQALNVYLDLSTGNAFGRLYVDDYGSHAYKDGKSFLEIEFEFQATGHNGQGELRATSVKGTLPDGEVTAEVER